MSSVIGVLGALLVGVGSALLPLLNAEVYAVATTGRAGPSVAALVVIALACGQTAGKLALFEAARRGSRRWRRHSSKPHRWTQRIRVALERRRTAVPLVLASAVIGLPPLAAVSLAAGASEQARWEFGVICLLGRTARFAALVLPASWALS